jgi:hypothetical protein
MSSETASAYDLRAKLGLLDLAQETHEQGLLRIAFDQARRTEVRQAAQRKFSPKPKRVAKPKKEPSDAKQKRPKRTRKAKVPNQETSG